MKNKVVMLALVAAAGAAVLAGAVHRVNTQVTGQYAEITRSPGYRMALQGTVEIAVAPSQPPGGRRVAPMPRPVRIYPDTPPLHLARSYVETDPSRYASHIRHAARATNVPAALIRAALDVVMESP